MRGSHSVACAQTGHADLCAAKAAFAGTEFVRLVSLPQDTARRLHAGMTFSEIESPEVYGDLLAANACMIEKRTDLGAEWTLILQQRQAMYRSLKASTIEKFGVEGYERYDTAYSFFVSLYEAKVLGGVRYVARKKAR